MKILGSAIVFIAVTSNVYASNEGIKETNASVSLSNSYADYGNNTHIVSSLRLPVYRQLGVNVGAGYSEFNGNNDFIDSHSTWYQTGLIYKKSDLGSLELSYEKLTTKTDYPSYLNSFDKTDSSQNYGISTSYFLQEFDISAQRTIINFDSNREFHTAAIRSGYYFNDNLRADILAGLLDAKKNYSLSIAYTPIRSLPKILMSCGYTFSPDNDSVSFTIGYLFGNNESLKQRIREY